MALTAKQEKFITSYIKLGNATDAAVAAGYSPKTAYAIGSENLKKPDIVSRRKELEAIIAKACIATPTKRLELLTRIAEHEVETPVSAGHVTMAIAEMNKMERIYEPESRNTYNEIKVLIIREQPKLVPVEFKEVEDSNEP